MSAAFNLDEAYQQMGGFGKFQWLALILLNVIRNFNF